jgi:hypothetical protein
MKKVFLVGLILAFAAVVRGPARESISHTNDVPLTNPADVVDGRNLNLSGAMAMAALLRSISSMGFGSRGFAYDSEGSESFGMSYDPASERVSANTTGTLDYYVSTTGSDSSGNGSALKPWATVEHASTLAGPGATVHIAAGSYIGSFKTYTSGTATARVTYVSDTKWGAKLVGTKGSTWANHGAYVDIVNFDVTGPGLNGIYTDADSTRIIGNHVHDMPVACTSTGGSGINLNGTDGEVEGNYVHDIGPYPDHCQYVHGIYFLKTGGHAYNNVSFRNSGWGIHLWHRASNLVIANNTLFNNLSGGIVVGNGDTMADYVVVINNIAYINKQGIKEEGKTGTHNIYKNNLVFQNSSSDFSLQHGNRAAGTVSADPQFVNFTGDSTGDYHLQTGSPAIGAGTSESAPATDFEGVRRPRGSACDIGAFEHASSATSSVAPRLTS